MRKIYGVGINDYEDKVKIDHKNIKSYTTWRNMLQRCYCKEFHIRQSSYVECTVCDEWLRFSNFKKWFDENYPYHLEEQGIKLELDKDILCKNNKIYSPDTCIFLPKRINSFANNKQKSNTSGYIGVCWHKIANKWVSTITDFDTGKTKYLGLFADIKDASNAYISARNIEVSKAKKYLKELGYDKNIIDKLEEL